MVFGETDKIMNNKLRAVLHAGQVKGEEDGVFKSLAEKLTVAGYVSRSVHENSDGTSRQCAAYFFGMANGLRLQNKQATVVTAICFDKERYQRPSRLYCLIRKHQERTFISTVERLLKVLRVMES